MRLTEFILTLNCQTQQILLNEMNYFFLVKMFDKNKTNKNNLGFGSEERKVRERLVLLDDLNVIKGAAVKLLVKLKFVEIIVVKQTKCFYRTQIDLA